MKRILQAGESRLPRILLCHEKFQLALVDDNAPTPLFLVPDYLACRQLLEATDAKFDQRGKKGLACSISDMCFCESKPMTPGVKAAVATLAGTAKKVVSVLSVPALLSAPVRELTLEWKRTLMLFAVYAATASNPILCFYKAMVKGKRRPGYLPLPDYANEAHKVHSLLSALAIVAFVEQEPCPAVPQAQVDEKCRQMDEDVLTIKCPGCSAAFWGFTGCFSVSCGCGTTFCGWCFQRFADAHGHVKSCNRNPNPGTYYGTNEQYQEARRLRKVELARAFLSGIADPDLRVAVFASCLQNLRDNKISVEQLNVDNKPYAPVAIAQAKLAQSVLQKTFFVGSLGPDTTLQWLQGFVLALATNTTPCNSDKDAVDIIAGMLAQEAPAIAAARFQQQILVVAKQTSHLNSALLWDERFEALVTQLSATDAALSLPRLFQRRTRLTEQSFWAHARRDPRFEFLLVLRDNQASLDHKLLCATARIVQFVGDVMHECRLLQLTRERATSMTIGQLAADRDCLSVDGRLDKILQDMRDIYSLVTQFQCKDKSKLDSCFRGLAFDDVAKVTFDDSTTVIHFLTNEEDETLLPAVLYAGHTEDMSWMSLCRIQEKVGGKLSSIYQRPGRPVRTYDIAEEDVIDYDPDAVGGMLQLYIEPGVCPTFTDDVHGIAMQIAYSQGIWPKPALSAPGDDIPQMMPLPFHEFPLDAQKSIIAFLPRRYQIYKPLPKAVAKLLRRLVAEEPSFSVCVVSFLTLLAEEIRRKPEAVIPLRLHHLGGLLRLELTEDQARGRTFLKLPLLASIESSQIATVFALAWNGVVTPEAREALPEDLCQQLRSWCEGVLADARQVPAVPAFLHAVRMVGVRFACVHQNAVFYDADVATYIDNVDIDFEPIDLADHDFFDSILFRHFGMFFQLVQESFQDVVEGNIVGEEDDDRRAIIPLAMLRPIFTRQKSEEQLPRPPKAAPIQRPLPPNQPSRSRPPQRQEAVAPRWENVSSLTLYQDERPATADEPTWGDDEEKEDDDTTDEEA